MFGGLRRRIWGCRSQGVKAARCLSSMERESISFDVLIVGAGPAGLSAAIRVKQLCAQHGREMSVCVVEKGGEVGSHILSGNVFDARAMKELFPNDWAKDFQEARQSKATKVTRDEFHIMTSKERSFQIPSMLLPNELHNAGENYIISLSQLCKWLASRAEEMGVEIYPGFAASEMLYNDDDHGSVKGVATRDVGLDKEGNPMSTFERGVALLAPYTLLAEGARGSCTETVIQKYGLRHTHQTYGLGLKEVWEVPLITPGLVQHSVGFPLQSNVFDKTFGGSFLYHQEPNLIFLGFVVGLDYANPYLNPYREFQLWKTHPLVANQLRGGTCLSYGARVLNEGGFHAIPSKLSFPGGALIGCGAGFLNSVKIKGTHTAMKSGMLAAEALFHGHDYDASLRKSWINSELYAVRNCHAAFSKWGILPGMAYTGLATRITRGREPWTLQHPHPNDSAATQPASKYTPKTYPPPDGLLTFDLMTNLQRSGTYHDEHQPSHLKVKFHCEDSLKVYAAPEQRFCPAGVYEYDDQDKLVINAQNCLHCKCCDIKTPKEYIRWTVPEGGGGPQYQIM